MLRTSTVGAQIGVREQAELEGLITYLRDLGYLPVIRSMLTGMFALAKLPEPEEETIASTLGSTYPFYRREPDEVLGDLFLTDDFGYTLVAVDRDTLQASVFGRGEGEKALHEFCVRVEEGVRSRFDGRRVRGMKFDWQSQKPRAARYGSRVYRSAQTLVFGGETEAEAEELESTPPDYRPEDVDAAKLLVDAQTRKFVSNLARVGKMRSRDAEGATHAKVLDSLLELRLAAEEYLLTCKRDQHTICLVPEKDDLTKEPMASLRCSVCERSFTDEDLQVIYTLTDSGKRLVDGSLWMSVWVTELLCENAVSKERVRWGLESGGEELDIMVEDFDSRILFELKDREFGLGDAYPFVYRIARYGGSLGVVATMDKVSPDAKKFFKEETVGRLGYPLQIRYFERSKGIEAGIAQLVDDMSRLQVRRLVQPFSRWVGLDLWPVLQCWIDKANPVCGNRTTAPASACT